MGVPASRPNCASVRLRSALILTPMMAKIVQTAKQAVNDTVLAQSAIEAPGALVSEALGMSNLRLDALQDALIDYFMTTSLHLTLIN
jgi:hypothetical protein